jgi:hypothetical protein
VLLPPRITPDEALRHRAFIESLGPETLWLAYLEPIPEIAAAV